MHTEDEDTSTTAPRRAHHGDLSVVQETAPTAATRSHRPFSAALVYHLASIEKTKAPGGGTGRDWYRYVLRNDNSTIQGFRRGSREHVSEYAAQYAEQLNTRTVLGPSPWSTRQKNPLRSR